MLSFGIRDIQTRPSFIKEIQIGKIVDKRAHETLGYFISSKYDKLIQPVIDEIEREEKISKLKRLKEHQDLEFAELGVDDGI